MNDCLRGLTDLFYPPKCMLCHRLLPSSAQKLCLRCTHRLSECEGLLRRVPYFEKAVAPFYYEGLLRESFLRYKFRGMRAYAEVYAEWMAVWVRDRLEGEYDLISWVPCGALRRWARGYDQAELLARALARQLNTPVRRTLKKKRNNPRQSTRRDAAARRANVLGVYVPYEPEAFSGRRILLVDDILTTGATLSECGKILRMAGSGDLVCAVLARTRSEKNE